MSYPQIATAVYDRFYTETPELSSNDRRVLSDMLRKRVNPKRRCPLPVTK
jgi:hypothetical protein